MNRLQKKGVMGPLISVFVMVLIISILVGLTFLFIASLKTTTASTTRSSITITNETSGWINQTGFYLGGVNGTFLQPISFAITTAYNNTNLTGGGTTYVIPANNYTVDSTTGLVRNASVVNWGTGGKEVNFTYTFSYIAPEQANAWESINNTEASGSTAVGYLPLIFLAVIFGAILTLVLKIILPYINLGQQMGNF